MKTLDEQILHIEKLHEHRQQAAMLRALGLEVLTKTKYDGSASGWRRPGDAVEKAMMLHVLRNSSKDTKTDDLRKERRKLLIEQIRKLKIEKWDDYDGNDPASDQVSIFRAAVLLQSLVEVPELVFSELALFCLHRIVRELYYVSYPTWAAGAARAGVGATPSSFVTGECTRALLSLHRALNQTATVVRMVGGAAARPSVKGNIKLWLDQEQAFRAESLQISVQQLRPWLVIGLPDNAEPSELLKAIIDALASVARPDLREFEKAVTLNDALEKAADVAACQTASSAVESVLDVVSKAHEIAESKDKAKKDPLGVAKAIAESLKNAADKVKDLLDPAFRYASSVIDRELASSSPHLGREIDAAELVFAATIVGRLSEWNHPKVSSAFELVRTLMDPDGRLLALRPFDIMSKGYRLHVATLEATRRVAELAGNVDVDPDPDFANMDGPDPDSGTCWECGYAYKRKPIIVYRTDFRASGDTSTTAYNLMLTESADVTLDLPFAEEERVASAIHGALQRLSMAPLQPTGTAARGR